MSEPTPVSLKAVADSLQITWSDGVTHHLTWKLLREACPCATCRDERERRQSTGTSPGDTSRGTDLLPVLSLAEARPLRVQSMHPVGNYAYGIDFTDGHTTGIYTLEQLRQLGEAVSRD